ncbi:MAG TPA: hypothetical protein VLF63_03825 [Patescibacteria group bacterium]|nr:hypothetical protein [Patescibacteria group bacterium]
MSEISTETDNWISQIRLLKVNTLNREKLLRENILEDVRLPDLDRAVLGFLCSEEKLVEYKKLSQRIGELATQPIVQIYSPRDGHIEEAVAGLLTGEVSVNLNYPPKGKLKVESASIFAEVDPVIEYSYSHGTAIVSVVEEFRVGPDAGTYDNDLGVGLIKLVTFREDMRARQLPNKYYPIIEDKPPQTLMGYQEVEQSYLLDLGVSSIMSKLVAFT